MRTVRWALVGAVAGFVFGVVWHFFDPGLGLYFWPVLGAVIFGQHAYRSRHDRDGAKPPTAGNAP